MSINAQILKLTNVLFVSDFPINLISVSQLNSKEILVVFDAEKSETTSNIALRVPDILIT